MSLRSSPWALILACLALVGTIPAGCGNGGSSAVTTGASNATTPADPRVKRPAFDSDKAWAVLLKQCDFGPRPVGSEAHKKTRDYLMAEMGKYADKTVGQDFTYKGMPLTNVIGVFNPEAKRSLLLCSHWDTRPTADMEIDEAKKKQPILGASDGASGIAVLLELARLFKEQKPSVGVVIVLLDGEDYGNFDRDEGVFLGSRYFARNHKGYTPDFGILLDMVGDKDLGIFREINSDNIAPGTNGRVFRIAKELGYGSSIVDKQGIQISDDHIALSQLGRIPTIDLIDFDYGPWHTLADRPDQCSAKSLGIVGDTVAEVVYREK